MRAVWTGTVEGKAKVASRAVTLVIRDITGVHEVERGPWHGIRLRDIPCHRCVWTVVRAAVAGTAAKANDENDLKDSEENAADRHGSEQMQFLIPCDNSCF
jgi:hypothetical protein